ncbi:MAG: hypothetical protein K2Q10_14085 [Rhodospirillales bacterium]|nr:hypothetical protein [Rhodospirillales bacterium]
MPDFDRPLYFMHINKTGGTSFGMALRKAFAPSEICPVGLIPELLALRPEELANYRLFAGHFGTGLASLLDVEPVAITLLRDPVARAISQFNAHLSNPSTAFHAAIVAHGGDLGRCLEDPGLAAMLSNYQLRFLGQTVDLSVFRRTPSLPRHGIQRLLLDEPGPIDGADLLAAACARMERMPIVGLIERFPETLRRLGTFLDVTIKDVPFENVSGVTPRYGTTRRLDRGDFPPAVIRRLEELNAWDLRLYEAATTLFERCDT